MTKITITGQGRFVRIRNVQAIEIFSVLEFVMSKFWTKVAVRGIFVALLAIGMQAISSNSFANNGFFKPDSKETRLATYDSAGETHFALSIFPKSETPSRATDVVVYIDTSASQTGAFKRDSIEAVKELVRNLGAEDRIQLFAVDLDPIPLTQGFVAPGSNDISVAMENLKQRVPLGSTDMEAMLTSATKAFAKTSGRNKNAIYIGDGISRGSILHTELLTKLVTQLADANVSVSSFAIGPDRNIELMAALANNTGGNLFIDSDEDNAAKNCGAGLARTVHASVFWPRQGKLDDSVVDMFPRRFPPMRSDRDSIVLGTLADRENVDLSISGVINGQEKELSWSLKPEPSSERFSFLPSMVNEARGDNGVSLPTVGSNGLKEFARSRTADAAKLIQLSDTAVKVGDTEAAKGLADAAIQLSAKPAKTKAYLAAMASTYKVQEDDPFGLGGGDSTPAAPTQDPFGNSTPDTPPAAQGGADPFGGTPPTDPFGGETPQPEMEKPAMEKPAMEPEMEKPAMEKPAMQEGGDIFGAPTEDTPIETLPIEPGQEQPSLPGNGLEVPMGSTTRDGGLVLIPQNNEDEMDQLLRDAGDASERVLLTQEDQIRIINERTQQQVVVEQKLARDEAISNPDLSIERIKNMLQIVDQTTGLYPATRAELRHTLESTLLSFRQKKLAFDERRALADINTAQGLEISAAAIRREREEERIVRLVNQFNTLLDEGDYSSSVEVAETALEVAEDNPTTVVAAEKAHFVRNYSLMTELRRQKTLNFQETMYETERSNIPFPGTPPLIFPDKEEWDAKVIRRAKYKNLRLTGSQKEEDILEALDKPLKEPGLIFEETPWSEIEEDLESRYGFNIILTGSAQDDSLTEDEPVTINLTGIRLKNALRIMLETKNATFVVQDEVLKIISLDDAEDVRWFVTNVYNVGDLVAPRQNFGGGGIGGGQGGGFGGGQGGGFGGGQGGGFGGGGQGGGGQGAGLFCIPQESKVNLKYSGNTAAPIDKPRRRAEAVNLTESNIPAVAWSTYFNNNFADPADVRLTAKKLMRAKKPAEVVSMISGAIKHGQMQPWMYEGLVLAMQVAGKPQLEIERGLMSVVDLSNNEDDLLHAAQYMAVNGMEHRAIRLFKSFARNNPTRTEPYVLGLRASLRVKDIEGIKWATAGVFSQEWPDHPEIVKQAKFAADSIKASLEKAKQLDELAAYENDLQRAAERDCYIKVSWTGDADMDLYVEEPGGTVCSRLVRRTTAGGVSLGDKFTPKKGISGIVSEEYVLPKGFAGDYRLIIKRVWGEVTSGKVTVAIHNHYKSDREASLTKQVKIDSEGAIVLFSLDQGRRMEALEDHAIRTVVKRQMTTNRNVLAQQLANAYSSGAASDYYGDQYNGSGSGLVGGGGFGGGLGGNNGGGLNGLRPGAVGYQPVITQIQEGTNFTVNHATTADRLHVLISTSPNFSLISEVATFNILGDASTAQGLAGGGAAGGGAGGNNNNNNGGGAGGGGVF